MNFYLNSFSSGAINKSSEDGVFKIPVLKRNTRERKRKIIPEAESPAPNKPPVLLIKDLYKKNLMTF